MKYSRGESCKPPMHQLPSVSTTLLRSCRLINTEAAPLLYVANVFYFSDPHTLQQFRWKTATFSKLSAWVEEIAVELLDIEPGTKSAAMWQNYLCGSGSKKKIWRLNDDFPHLKRLTLVLTGQCSLLSPPQLLQICKCFGQNLSGLDWVHVVGLNNSDMVPSLKPIVCTTKFRDSEGTNSDLLLSELGTVQTHVSEYECASGWKNVTLWRGSPESRPPFVPSPLAGMGRERTHLFRFETRGAPKKENVFSTDQRRDLLMEQNARLLRRAKGQAKSKPEDVALQQELGDLRIEILDRKCQLENTQQLPAFQQSTPEMFSEQTSYQLQLMMLEQQNKKRLLMARAEQEHGTSQFSLSNLRNRLVEQESKLRSLEVQSRHSDTAASDAELTGSINRAKTAVQELQRQFDDAVRHDAALAALKSRQKFAESVLSLRHLRHRHGEQIDRLRSLEIWARHSGEGRSNTALTEEVDKARTLVRQLRNQIDDGMLRYDAASDEYRRSGGDVSQVSQVSQFTPNFDMTFGDFNGSQHVGQFDFDFFLQSNMTSIDFNSFQQGSDISNIEHFSFKDGAAIVTGI
ncbi:MAG: hypothetical protein Q9192_001874 [Flavoplaca navasiana]